MNLKPARVLAVETSCDETACAIIENGRALLSSVVASQMEIHARYGGVFPEVASRQHVLSVTPVVDRRRSAVVRDVHIVRRTQAGDVHVHVVHPQIAIEIDGEGGLGSQRANRPTVNTKRARYHVPEPGT